MDPKQAIIEEASVVAAYEFCVQLRDGVASMTKQQFRDSLKRSINATSEYADGCWVSFQNNPAAYLASRSPKAQSMDLIRVILSNR